MHGISFGFDVKFNEIIPFQKFIILQSNKNLFEEFKFKLQLNNFFSFLFL